MTIKESVIEKFISDFIDDIVDYDSVVNQFFLPLIKQKIENSIEEIEEEIRKQKNKFKRIREAYVDEVFTLEEYDLERKKVENTLEELETKLYETEICDELKFTPEDILIKKDNYVLKQEDKDKLINYIEQVDKTNTEYKNTQSLSITLNNVDTEIKENHEKIKTLTENNESLELRVETLTKNNKVKDKQIEELKEENLSLRQSLSFWKDRFLKVISFIKDKLFGKQKERDKYMDFADELYDKKIIDDNTYEFSKDHDYNNDKDDFDIEI